MTPFARRLGVAFALLCISQAPTSADVLNTENPRQPVSAPSKSGATTGDDYLKLKGGEVLTSLSEEGDKKYVTGRIMIDDTPEKVWKIMVNPFEFERKISPRMTKVEVLEEDESKTVLRCSMEIGLFIPSMSYIVESHYDKYNHVTFKRIGGVFKDFRGSWVLIPHDGGKRTEIMYSMYVDTGMPLPKWFVREAVKMELPHTLTALRARILALGATPANKTILAAD